MYYKMALSETYRQIGYDIIASAFEVRNTIGRGVREKFYEGALAYEIAQKEYLPYIKAWWLKMRIKLILLLRIAL